MFEDNFVKYLWITLTVAVVMLIEMVCFYLGWNNGFVPILTNGVTKIEFWNTFYLFLFFSAVLFPVTVLMNNNNKR